MIGSKKILVKVCKLKDAKFLLKVHNTAVKGGYFNSKNMVLYKPHVKWLKNKLNSNSSKIYIGYQNSLRFGYVRFDEVKKNIYEVSIGNVPSFYGKGLGNKMLNLSLKKFNQLKKPKKIISVVKKFNKRSQKCFLKNNFILTKFDKNKLTTINKLNKKKENYFELNPRLIN